MTALPPLQPGTPEQNALWDHVYEYGHAAEGVHGLLEKVCQAYALAAAPPAPQASVEQQEPMFWVRLCSNGMYEGPLHDKQLEDVRRHSGAWTPLYTHPAQQAKPQPLSDQEIADAAPVNETLAHGFKLGVRWAEAAHGIKE